jgi:hypothetical protein
MSTKVVNLRDYECRERCCPGPPSTYSSLQAVRRNQDQDHQSPRQQH